VAAFRILALGLAGLWLGGAIGLSGLDARGETSSPVVAGEVVGGETVEAIPLTPSKSPRFMIDQTSIDLGDVARGTTARYRFEVTNAGETPLELDAKRHCGCTVVRHDKVIAPGGKGEVEAELQTINFRGRIEKVVELTTNDPARRSLYLALKANVVSAMTIIGDKNPLIVCNAQDPTVYEMALQASNLGDVAITEAKCDAAYAAVKLSKIEDDGAERNYRLAVTIGPDAPVGRNSFVVTLSTTAPLERTIPLTFYCEKGISAAPAQVRLGRRWSRSGGAEQTVIIRKSGGPFQVGKITASDPRLKVTSRKVNEGSLYLLTVGYQGDHPELAPPGLITIETNDHQQPLLEIPVCGCNVSTPLTSASTTASTEGDMLSPGSTGILPVQK
jgi:hypothetical protein